MECHIVLLFGAMITDIKDNDKIVRASKEAADFLNCLRTIKTKKDRIIKFKDRNKKSMERMSPNIPTVVMDFFFRTKIIRKKVDKDDM
jgi:hypothetical protein